MELDLGRLKSIVGEENVADNAAELFIYGGDASVHHSMPDVVIAPRSVEQVQKIAAYANEHRVPLIARGSGSGCSGHAVPIDGGIVMDLKRMNRVLEIRPDDTLVRVETGVIDDELNRALKPHGFFWPAGPASSKIATIGGEIGANASGIRSVKYGATRDSVLGMKVVMADGRLLEMGANTRVHSAGYHLEKLMVGSEGTLGIVVEATLKIVPLPLLRCMGIACFDTVGEAGETIRDVMSGGCSPSVLELMDNIAISVVNSQMDMGLPDVEAILLFEADGKSREAVDQEIQSIRSICEKHGGHGIKMSYDAGERARIFMGRKKLFAALSRYKPGIICTDLADDMAVPYSRMAEATHKIHEIAKRWNVIMSVYGHCGSGVVHTKIMLDVTKRRQWEDAKNAAEELYDYINEAGGVISGEHGIALSKAPYWKKANRDLIPIMRAVKKAFDPNNILNPHKIMDAPDDWVTATDLRYRITA